MKNTGNTHFCRIYETPRLQIRILDDSATDMVLSFLNKGADIFNSYESEKPSDFYTRSFQKKVLRFELDLALQKKGVRFYIFEKSNPTQIIGTFSISAIRPAPFQSGMIGYKLLPEFWHQGYATEALEKITSIAAPVLDIRRYEAYVLPDNIASCRLLSRVGFELEGTARSNIEINGIRRDHLQYSYIIS